MARPIRFLAEDDGSAVVDWVILMAATAALSLALMGQLSPVLEAAGLRLGDRLVALEIPVSFEAWDDLRASLNEEPPLTAETSYVETRF